MTAPALLLSLVVPSGTSSFPFRVGEDDVTLQLRRLPLHPVCGRIVMSGGRLPVGDADVDGLTITVKPPQR